MKVLTFAASLLVALSSAFAFTQPATDPPELPNQFAEVVLTVEGMT